MTCTVSVALAAYNGEAYISQQLASILCQLSSHDEIIISLNPGTDHTEEMISSFHDHRIRVFPCGEKGIIANFDNAIRHCQNDIIFLCDQDDVWVKDKVQKICACFMDQDVVLVEHDCAYVDEHLRETGETLFHKRHPHTGFLYNYVHNTYQGSCMAFRRELVPVISPIPRDIAMHDQWIGMLAEKMGKVVFLDEPLLLYRRHEYTGSADDHIPIMKKIGFMEKLWQPYHERIKRLK
jgi:glycosyltransferase involved in cell wall biosynthesis